MSYLFSGEICGRLCPECDEPLVGSTIRLYRPEREAGGDGGGVATATRVKQTLAILTPQQVEAKQALLLAEATLDENGRFAVQLGESYDGGAFEIDVDCATVPHLKRKPRSAPVQFVVTTLTPEWHEEKRQSVAEWETCLPSQFWSVIRKQFGGWVICGHCHAKGTTLPVADVVVSAFDVDWIQDDPLGTATTDASGHFRIDYSLEDFERTPLGIPFELTQPGPDVYFHCELNGAPVLDEPRTRGRDPDREDVGPVFCVELELDVTVGPPVKDAHFTHAGDFDIDYDIDHTTGLTNKAVLGHGGPGYAFWGSVLFRGFCPKVNPGNPAETMRYRFLYDDGSGDTPIAGAMIAPISAGSRPIQWDFGGGPVWVWQPIVIQGTGVGSPDLPVPASGPTVPDHVIVADGDGWIEVDQRAIDDGFFDLLGFDTAAVVPGGAAPVGSAGSAVPTPENGKSLKITFQAATVAPGPPNVIFTNDLAAFHVNNWVEAHALWITQLGGGCNGIASSLDLEWTVDHELLRDFSVGISSAAGPQPLSNPLPSGVGPRGGFGTVHEDTSGWAKCSYTASLTAQLRMTDGHYDDSGRTYPLTFCKT